MSTTKECMAYYFESTGEGVWKCRICSRSIRQKKNAGYSNLQSHISMHEPEYKSKFEEDRANGGGTLDSFGFINEKTKDMFYWIKWIVDLSLCMRLNKNDAVIFGQNINKILDKSCRIG